MIYFYQINLILLILLMYGLYLLLGETVTLFFSYYKNDKFNKQNELKNFFNYKQPFSTIYSSSFVTQKENMLQNQHCKDKENKTKQIKLSSNIIKRKPIFNRLTQKEFELMNEIISEKATTKLSAIDLAGYICKQGFGLIDIVINSCYIHTAFQLFFTIDPFIYQICRHEYNHRYPLLQIIKNFIVTAAQNSEESIKYAQNLIEGTKLVLRYENPNSQLAASPNAEQDCGDILSLIIAKIKVEFENYIKDNNIDEPNEFSLHMTSYTPLTFDVNTNDVVLSTCFKESEEKNLLNMNVNNMPSLLFINFPRYEYNIEGKIIDYEYNLHADNQITIYGKEYMIRGAVIHKGSYTGKGGHIYALAKKNKKWFKLDDSICKKLELCKVRKRIKRNAAILFYTIKNL